MRGANYQTVSIASILVSGLVSGIFIETSQIASAQTTPQTEMHQEHQGHSAPGPLVISYAGKSESWTPSTLAALPHATIALYNAHTKSNQTYSGVPLITLLTRLGFPDKPHGKDFRIYLVAEGADGYQVVYSGGEVTPDLHDGTTLVADSVDGQPLGDSGVFQLVATGDKRPARWVRNLVSIRVLTVQ